MVTGIVLTLGLWPFHARRNGVAWISQERGLQFDKDSTVLSSGPLRVTESGKIAEATLEIWVESRNIWDSGTLLAFYRPQGQVLFGLREVQTALLIQASDPQSYQRHQEQEYLPNVFRRSEPGSVQAVPAFITITSGRSGTAVYFEGKRTVLGHRFSLPPSDFDGWLVLGDSPGQPDSWKGRMLGFGIYDRQLDETEVLHDYFSWTNKGRPESPAEHLRALYLFDERTGRTVHDHARSGIGLVIPERYKVADKIALEPFWSEFNMSRSYWGGALKNVIGFVPFGFCIQAYFLVVRHSKRSTWLAVALGFLVSLTIEILQAFLPNRDSGTSDLITNTLGTWIGAVSCWRVVAAVSQKFPQLNAFVPQRDFTSR